MKYKIKFTTQPSKVNKSDEEVESVLNKAISLLVDELILNGHLKTDDTKEELEYGK